MSHNSTTESGPDFGVNVGGPAGESASPHEDLGKSSQILGTLFAGKYTLLRRLGTGKKSEVFEAQHAYHKRHCAVKILHADAAGGGPIATRFRAEAQAIANLKHASIAEVLDFGTTSDGRPFFVLEHLEGETLAQRLTRQKKIAPELAVEFAIQTLCALAHAHMFGILHLDLNPKNLFLCQSSGKRGLVKVLDVGMTRILRGDVLPAPLAVEGMDLRHRGTGIGTPGFVAPECVFGRAEIDHRADLFSVGAILYLMVTGQMPFAGEAAHEILKATSVSSVVRPRRRCPEIGDSVENAILIALAKRPGHRFQAAQDFLDYLDHATGAHRAQLAAEQEDATEIDTKEVWDLDDSGPLSAEQPDTASDDDNETLMVESKSILKRPVRPTPVSGLIRLKEFSSSLPASNDEPPTVIGKAQIVDLPWEDKTVAAHTPAPQQDIISGIFVAAKDEARMTQALDWRDFDTQRSSVPPPQGDFALADGHSFPPVADVRGNATAHAFGGHQREAKEAFSRFPRPVRILLPWIASSALTAAVFAFFLMRDKDPAAGDASLEPASEIAAPTGALPREDPFQGPEKLLWLSTSPSQVQVSWEGEAQDRQPIRLRQDDRPGELTISAAGFRDAVRIIAPRSDKLIRIELERLESAPREAFKP